MQITKEVLFLKFYQYIVRLEMILQTAFELSSKYPEIVSAQKELTDS